MNVMAIDLETKNMSHEIGGFGNTHMFQVSTVTTWDGSTGTAYVDEAVDTFAKGVTSSKVFVTSSMTSMTSKRQEACY